MGTRTALDAPELGNPSVRLEIHLGLDGLHGPRRLAIAEILRGELGVGIPARSDTMRRRRRREWNGGGGDQSHFKSSLSQFVFLGSCERNGNEEKLPSKTFAKETERGGDWGEVHTRNAGEARRRGNVWGRGRGS